jgi:type III secretion protein U
MASKDQGADKTEQPTAKKLRDARKEGNVSKSRELTGTVLVLGWLVGGWLLMGFMYAKITTLFNESLAAIQQPFEVAVRELAANAFDTLLWLCLPLLGLAVFLGLLVEFLQVGPVATMKKVTPNVAQLNPVEGLKKMFSMDNLVELVKSIVKSGALIAIGAYVLWGMLDQLLLLPYAPPAAIGSAIWYGLLRIVMWTIFVFFFVSAIDAGYQKYSYLKQLRMSRRDIKQEVKENEGDPYVKQRRRQLHQEWSQQNMLNAVRGSNVVVTNPTHIAVALQYEHGVTDLPVVVAKGEGTNAEMIKRAAEEAGVPILQNIELARGLNERTALDDYIGGEFFDAVAEVLKWAEEMRRVE